MKFKRIAGALVASWVSIGNLVCYQQCCCLYSNTGRPTTSDQDTRQIPMIMPAIMLAEEVEEVEDSPIYDDLFINYPRDLMNSPLKFENIC